jgi:phenylacetate-CoA ligase
MNLLLNPVFLVRFLPHYLAAVNRARRLKPSELRRFQDRALRRTLKYADRVPLYHRKYREAGVHIDDIRGIHDLPKLPLITKKDLIAGYPNDIVPVGFNRARAAEVGTSGSSGRPMTMYKDALYIFIEALAGERQLRAYDMSWRTTRITNIGDFSVPNTTDEESLTKVLLGNLSTFFTIDNFQNLYTGEPVRTVLDRMESFKPELVIGYTSMLMGLASLKKYGKGTSVCPRIIISSGEVLDTYSRAYIEKAFDVPVLNLYATTEGGSIAFECLGRSFHINADFTHVEILDTAGVSVADDTFGSVVVTRLYGGGTPIIRYTGLNDIASLSSDVCGCGLHTPLLKTLEGRKKDAIILPDGRVFPPATIPMPLAEAAAAFRTLQIQRFQFVQHAPDTIEIRVVIDENERDKPVSVEHLLAAIEKNYRRLVGDAVTVTVREVADVERIPGDPSPPLVISEVPRTALDDALL